VHFMSDTIAPIFWLPSISFRFLFTFQVQSDFLPASGSLEKSIALSRSTNAGVRCCRWQKRHNLSEKDYNAVLRLLFHFLIIMLLFALPMILFL